MSSWREKVRATTTSFQRRPPASALCRVERAGSQHESFGSGTTHCQLNWSLSLAAAGMHLEVGLLLQHVDRNEGPSIFSREPDFRPTVVPARARPAR